MSAFCLSVWFRLLRDLVKIWGLDLETHEGFDEKEIPHSGEHGQFCSVVSNMSLPLTLKSFFFVIYLRKSGWTHSVCDYFHVQSKKISNQIFISRLFLDIKTGSYKPFAWSSDCIYSVPKYIHHIIILLSTFCRAEFKNPNSSSALNWPVKSTGSSACGFQGDLMQSHSQHLNRSAVKIKKEKKNT